MATPLRLAPTSGSRKLLTWGPWRNGRRSGTLKKDATGKQNPLYVVADCNGRQCQCSEVARDPPPSAPLIAALDAAWPAFVRRRPARRVADLVAVVLRPANPTP